MAANLRKATKRTAINKKMNLYLLGCHFKLDNFIENNFISLTKRQHKTAVNEIKKQGFAIKEN